MSASEKFKLGDRVKLSEKGVCQFKNYKTGRTGVVSGLGNPETMTSVLVYIDRDNIKFKNSGFHMDFWEKEIEHE
jgi:hypothetical protein